MKLLGTILLALGVAVSAAAAIQLGSTEYSAKVEEGRAALGESTQSGSPIPALTATASVRLSDWFGQAGVQFAAGLALLALGATMGRVAIGRSGAEDTAADGHDFHASLQQLIAEIEETRRSIGSATDNESRVHIERLTQEWVLPMIEARYALQRQFGLAGFATVLGPLSGGERLLNRAWSTLVDGNTQECAASLAGATAEFQRAYAELQNLEQ